MDTIDSSGMQSSRRITRDANLFRSSHRRNECVTASTLTCGVDHGRVDAVRLLLSLNADTTKTADDGETAFQMTRRIEIKQLFLDHEKKSVM